MPHITHLVHLILVAANAATTLFSTNHVEDQTEKQFTSLQDFYEATGGDTWALHSDDVPWNFVSGAAHDPCEDHWVGLTCNSTLNCDSEFCAITQLALTEYNLTGSLPERLSGLIYLNSFDVGYNALLGTVPTGIAELSNLQSISLGQNAFAGQLPLELNHFKFLTMFDVIHNHLNGTIPDFTNSISTMKEFYLGENSLTGSIPSTISLMTNLEYIYLTQNRLNGTIPSSIFSELTRLYYLGLSTNCFTGTLPDEIGQLKNLGYLMLNNNSLNGPIPTSIATLSKLEFWEMNFNSFSGPLPVSIGDMSKLFVIEICDNMLNGTLPTSLGKLNLLSTLYLDGNLISGSLPKELGNLQNLTGLLLYKNKLTGTLPAELGYLERLEELSLYENRLEGLIPECITNMPSLVQLVLQKNFFSGFACVENKGNDCSFNMSSLQRLDISDNHFEGVLPMQIFSGAPSLKSIAAVNNCFHGYLQDDICLARSLEVLSLDGLTSGHHCKTNKDLSSFTKGYIVKHYMSGGLPGCIWNMPNLTVLHVAGNGLTGTLPSKLPPFSKLVNVSLAYNRFSGSIPNDFQTWPFVELCVGYNKLSGYLSSSDRKLTKNFVGTTGTAVGSVLSVEVNRLTGYVPSDMEMIGVLDALNGNFFMCDEDHPLPANDEQSSYYICGSKNLDQSLTLWVILLSLIALLGIMVVAMHCYQTKAGYSTISATDDSDVRRSLLDAHICDDDGNTNGDSKDKIEIIKDNGKVKCGLIWNTLWGCVRDTCKYVYSLNRLCFKWFQETMQLSTNNDFEEYGSDDGSVDLKNVQVFISLLCMIRRSSILLTVLIVAVCVPMYLLLKLVWPDEYSTHTHQYGWLISAAFLTGPVPASMLLVVFIGLCCVLAYSLVMLYPSTATEAHFIVRQSMVSYHRDSGMRTSNCFTTKETHNDNMANGVSRSNFSMGNSASNSSFAVDVSLSKSSSANVTLPQILAFTLLFIVNVVITVGVNILYVYGFNSSTHYYVKASMKGVLAIFQIFWNLIIVPKSVEFVAHLVHDSSSRVKWLMALCLSFNYIIAPAMGSVFSSSTCFADYFEEQPSVVSFYSYDICRAYSLDIETNTRFCTEVASVGFSTNFIPPFTYYYQCSSTLITTYVAVFMIEHAILVVFPTVIVFLLSFQKSAYFTPHWLINAMPSIVWPPQYQPGMTKQSNFPGAFLRPDRMMAAFMSQFVVLISYGLADPFLAVTICIAISSLTILAQVLIGRYLAYFRLRHNDEQQPLKIEKSENGNDSAEVHPLVALNAICSGILNGLPSSLWTIIVIASVFMGSLLVDIASDKITWEKGIWYGLPVVGTPLLAYLTMRVTLAYSFDRIDE